MTPGIAGPTGVVTAGIVSAGLEPHRLGDGLALWLDAHDEAIGRAIVEDRYELNELDFVTRTVRPGARVIDAGAHAGAYTVRLARRVGPLGRVTAIEPRGLHVEWLRRSVAENGMNGWVDVLHAAAGERDGEGWLCHPPAGSSSAHSWLGREAAGGMGEAVAVVRLDAVADRADFVKIDVEGAESLVLRGAVEMLEASRPILLVELHPRAMPRVAGETPAGLIAWMANAGYECRLLGAGVPGEAIADTPSNGVTSVVFLPR